MKKVYSFVYAISYVVIAFAAAGLGPLIPVKARLMNVTETDFKVVFVFKGVGCLMGALLGLKIQKILTLHRAMAVAYLLTGVSSLIVYLTDHLLVFEFMFLLIEFSKMIVNICTTVCILRAFQNKGEVWIKIFHFSFGIGAFTTPLLLKAFGISAYLGYATLTIPVALFMLICKQLEREPEKMSIADASRINEETMVDEIAEDKGLMRLQTDIPLRFDLLAASFLMCSTGNEGSFGGWITSYGTINHRMPVDTALMGESIYWVAMTAGRGLVIPLSLIWSNSKQLLMLVIGIFSAIILSNIFSWLQMYDVVIYGGSAIMGICMSGVYPLTMSLPTSLGLTVSPKNTSRYAMGGCLGTALIPYLVGIVMAQFGPNALFWCMAIVAIIMAFIFKRLVKEGENLRKRQRIINVAEHVSG